MGRDRAITGFASGNGPENFSGADFETYPGEAEKTGKEHAFFWSFPVFSAPLNQAPGEAFMLASECQFLCLSFEVFIYMACNDINKYTSIT